MKTILASFTVLILLFPNSVLGQFKHDIGMKVNSNEYERFQLEYRWHPNEKWAFTTAFTYGTRFDYYTYSHVAVEDSLITYYTNTGETISYNISVGAMRKLNFMKHNYYYLGANIGVGGLRDRNSSYRNTYTLDSTALTYGVYQPGEDVDGWDTHNSYNSFSTVSRVYLGADVPILDRLSLNMEAGIWANMSFYQNNSVYFNSRLYASAGLRYRFGRDLKE